MAGEPWWAKWDPDQVTVSQKVPDDAWKTCVIQEVYFGENEYNGSLGGRVSSVFVILVTSLIATLFPVVASRLKRLRIPTWVYMIARNFGSGVIISTAFIHLMDPAYDAIGGNSCVGMTGNWAQYSFNAAIMLSAAVFVFIVDVYCDFFAEAWYGVHSHGQRQETVIEDTSIHADQEHIHSHDLAKSDKCNNVNSMYKQEEKADIESVDSAAADYYSQFAGFLVLEFGVMFHSVMIGLNLGATDEYATLYPVLVFHQAFEGLGIGARLSEIPFPQNRRWVPWLCCIAYSFTTPICIAIGLGVRTTYRSSGYNANVIEGVLDSLSAGVLFYTGFVELLARDFIFNSNRTKNVWQLTAQLVTFLWGAGLMALLGKWA